MKKGVVWIALAVLMMITTLTYSGHFHNSFHFDDIHTIFNNGYIRDLHNVPRFFTDATTSSSLPANQSYRPLLTTTLALDYWLGGGLVDTFRFHLTSYFIFILLGVLMFVFYRHLLRMAAGDGLTDWVALFAVAVFMLHPTSAETVNYIIQRGDLLSAFFVVLALVLYSGSPFSRRYFIYLLPIAAGILSKPSTLIFAPILFCYIVLFETETGFLTFFKGSKRTSCTALLAMVVAFVLCIAGYLLIARMTSATYQEGRDSAWMYRITQPFVVLYYFSAWFAPIHLTVSNGWPPFTSVFDPLAIVGYAFVIILISAIFITSEKKSTRPIAFGLAWFLLANVPTSFIAFAEVENDHRMFFPFIGLTLAMVWAIHLSMMCLSRRLHADKPVKAILGVAITIILLGCIYGTYQRNKTWLSEETLWLDATIKSPDNGVAFLNYGIALMNKGDYTTAETCFTKALAMMPASPNAYLDLGIVKHALHKDNEVEANLVSAMNYGRTSCPQCYYYYALFLNEKGRKDEAIKTLYASYQLSDANVETRDLLLELLYKNNRIDELRQLMTTTLAKFPTDIKANLYAKLLSASPPSPAPTTQTAEDHLNLSGQAYRTGDYQRCIDEANTVLELKPDFAPAYNNLAAAYNKLSKYKEAKDASLKALHLDPSSHFARINLDAAESGLKKKAK